eukprot:SAG31_NODE_794_length_12043_cov_7.416192_5_plen_129_part_00
MEEPSLIHHVVAPAGSTLLFGETTIHATAEITSGKERVVLSTGYGASHFPYWDADGGYKEMPAELLARVPSQLKTLFAGRHQWVRGGRYRPLAEHADERPFELGETGLDRAPVVDREEWHRLTRKAAL